MRHKWSGSRLCWGIAACLVPAASAQLDEPQRDPTPRPSRDQPDVYVNDSFEAADVLNKAETLVQRGRWADAAQLLQRTVDRSADRLVRVEPGAYTGIRRYVADRIARWPRQGIEEYRRLYESDVEAAWGELSASRSVAELLALFERYFCTRAAARIADVIGQLAIEAGDFPVAVYVYRRLLQHHPDSTIHASRCRAMLAILAAMRGQAPPESFDDATRLRWMGQDRGVREVVDEIRRSFSPNASDERLTSWPIFGGNAARNRSTVCAVDEPGLLWRFDWLAPGDDDPQRDRSQGDARRPRSEPTIFPVVADRLVVAQWFREVVALHQVTGAVAWRFGRNPDYTSRVDYLDDVAPGWDSPTVRDGRVYVAMPADESPYAGFDSPRAVSELVCLDLKTGRPVWRAGPGGTDDALAEISFDSSPVLRDGSVYVVGRRRRSFGFEDAYLYRIRAADGAIVLRTHLGSASTGSGQGRTAARSVISVEEDRAYVCTNLGSLAAVSVHTGDVLWLRLYEPVHADPADDAGRSGPGLRSWNLNPPIPTEGHVVVLPADSDQLLVLSAESGEIRQSISVKELAGVDSLLGARGGLLCGVGDQVFCFELDSGRLRWSAPLPGAGGLAGRGQWVADELWIPRDRGLSRFRTSDGDRTDAPWDAEGDGGNLLALGDQLFVAGAGRIAAYVRKADIWNTLRARMDAAPDDPVPAIEFAEASLGAGETSEAMKALDQAILRARRSAALDPSLQERLVQASLKFARTLQRRSSLDIETLDRLSRSAEQFANQAELGVRYRLAFAGWFEDFDRPDRALQLYQQLLQDRSLREFLVPMDAAGPRRAAAVAEEKITALLESYGRAPYAPFEAQAAQWLETASAAKDAEMLQRLVDTYPNSASAPRALIAQGDLLAEEGKIDPAARQFGIALHRYPRLVDRPALLRKVADTFQRGGMHERAYRWLTKAAREYPGERFEFEGRLLSFAQYRDRLRGPQLRIEPSRPAVSLPLDGDFEIPLGEEDVLLAPRFGDHPRGDWSRFFVRRKARVHAYDARGGASLWDAPLPDGGPADLLWTSADTVVLAGSRRVVALGARDGALRWAYPGSPDHPDPGADWEALGGALRFHDLQGERLLSVREDGRIFCLSLDTGRPVWTRTVAPVPASSARLFNPWVVYPLAREERAGLVLLDAETGDTLDEITLDTRRPIEEYFVTLNGQLIAVTTQAVTAFDIETRKQTWGKAVASGIKPGTVVVDIDVLFFIADDGELRKMSLDDGRMLWNSPPRVLDRGPEDLTVQLQEGMLIVSSLQHVAAVDTVDGQVLWRGTTPEKCRLVARAITTSDVVAVDLLDGLRPGRSAAYFYDHRNRSGLIAKTGGAPDLGPLDDVRTVLALDDALVLHAGGRLRGLVHR